MQRRGGTGKTRWVAPGGDLSSYAVVQGGLYDDLNLRKRQVFKAWKNLTYLKHVEREEFAILHAIALKQWLGPSLLHSG